MDGMHFDSTRMTGSQIVGETRKLPEEDEAEVADRIDCLGRDDVFRAVEAAWQQEIHRRIADLESGRTQGIPLEETLAKARAITDL